MGQKSWGNVQKADRKSAHPERNHTLYYELTRVLGNTVVPLGLLQVQKQQMQWVRETDATGINCGAPLRTNKQRRRPPLPQLKQQERLLLGWNHQCEYLGQRGREVTLNDCWHRRHQKMRTYCVHSAISLSQGAPRKESTDATIVRRLQARMMP